jgi:hypothetical protein
MAIAIAIADAANKEESLRPLTVGPFDLVDFSRTAELEYIPNPTSQVETGIVINKDTRSGLVVNVSEGVIRKYGPIAAPAAAIVTSNFQEALKSFGVDPIANQIGFHLLTKVDGLHGLWTQLYNMPLVPYTKFDNTIVLGSFVIGLILLLPMYVAAHWGIVAYRKTLREKVQNWKITKVIQASTFYKYYVSFRGLTGE